jgi:hypothetical protein
MRSLLVATLSASAFLAIVSAASAEGSKETTDSSRNTSSGTTVSDNVPGITAEQHRAVPYHPCREALGWVNGRLRCNNY